jgi:hypothetical protein
MGAEVLTAAIARLLSNATGSSSLHRQSADSPRYLVKHLIG